MKMQKWPFLVLLVFDAGSNEKVCTSLCFFFFHFLLKIVLDYLMAHVGIRFEVYVERLVLMEYFVQEIQNVDLGLQNCDSDIEVFVLFM